jgi:hypothetical protein
MAVQISHVISNIVSVSGGLCIDWWGALSAYLKTLQLQPFFGVGVYSCFLLGMAQHQNLEPETLRCSFFCLLLLWSLK